MFKSELPPSIVAFIFGTVLGLLLVKHTSEYKQVSTDRNKLSDVVRIALDNDSSQTIVLDAMKTVELDTAQLSQWAYCY